MTRRLLATIAVLSTTALPPDTVAAIRCVPFADFAAPAPSDLQRLNLKLTLVGYWLRPVSSVVLRCGGGGVDIRPSILCNKRGGGYARDALDLTTCSVDSASMRAAIAGLSTMPDLIDGGADAEGFISVSIIDPGDTTSRVFDSIVDFTTADQALARLQTALAPEDSATRILSTWLCELRIGRPQGGMDETHASVTLSGMRYRTSDGLYGGKIRVRNTSMGIIPAPASVIVQFEGDVRGVQPDGITDCTANPPAASYYHLPVGPGLGPGDTAEIPIRVVNAKRQRVRLSSARVFSGM